VVARESGDDERGDTVLYPGDYSLLVDEPTVAEVKFLLVGGKWSWRSGRN
jgi:hypothetical protein